MPAEPEWKRATAHYSPRALASTLPCPPNTRAQTEEWLSGLGVPLIDIDVWRGGEWVTEKHVDDPETLDETIAMTLVRTGGRYALHRWNGRWRLVTGSRRGPSKRFRYYDTREAAEMVVIHNG